MINWIGLWAELGRYQESDADEVVEGAIFKVN